MSELRDLTVTPPMRTCVGCRRVEPQPALVRIILSDGRAVVDARRRLPGRGAWVHPRRACVHNAARGGLQRSFRRPVDPAALLTWAESAPSVSGVPAADDLSLATAAEKS